MEVEKMEWKREEINSLIRLYEQETVLWNVTSPNHKNSICRLDALQRIADAMEKTCVEVGKKLHTLRSQYKREKLKIVKSNKSGCSASDVYVPRWQYFNKLGFLSASAGKILGKHVSSLNPVDPETPEILQNTSDNIPEEEAVDSPDLDSDLLAENKLESAIKDTPCAPPPIRKKRVNESSVTGFEKKFNHAYKVFTNNVNKQRDEDICFGEYVTESLRKIEDRKIKAWIRHSITNIFYQAECGGSSFPLPTYPGPTFPMHPRYSNFSQQNVLNQSNFTSNQSPSPSQQVSPGCSCPPTPVNTQPHCSSLQMQMSDSQSTRSAPDDVV